MINAGRSSAIPIFQLSLERRFVGYSGGSAIKDFVILITINDLNI